MLRNNTDATDSKPTGGSSMVNHQPPVSSGRSGKSYSTFQKLRRCLRELRSCTGELHRLLIEIAIIAAVFGWLRSGR